MLRKIASYILRHRLLHTGDRVLAAVSGGADSVALLLSLRQLGYHAEVAHCNFHLRGAESDRDERFVRQLCERLQVACHVRDFDTAAYAATHGMSIEMAARELRYNWFETLRKETGCACIAVAHHREDNAETVLLNLVRGTGLRGLRGIRPRNGHVVRPLLCLSRAEIERYLREQGQDYVTDSTNLQDNIVRNKIRHQVLPLLAEINPAAMDNLLTTADNMAEVEKMYRFCAEEFISASLDSPEALNIDMVLRAPSPLCVLHEVLAPFGFNRAQLEEVVRAIQPATAVGKRFSSPTYDLLVDREQLILQAHETKASREEAESEPRNGFTADRETAKAACGQGSGTLAEVCAAHAISVTETPYPIDFNPNPRFAYFDKAKLGDRPVSVRLAHTGDRFVPFGMTQSKLVSDFLTDQKATRFEKERQEVLLCGEEIAWVVGRRSSNLFRVDSGTKTVLVLERKEA